MRLIILFGCVALASTAGAAEPTVETAQAQVRDLSFKAAERSLARVAQTRNLRNEDVITWHALKGIVAGSLKDAKGARDAFRALLNLNLGYRLEGRFSPRVMTPFFEAKRWAEENGALTVDRSPPLITEGQVRRLSFAVKGDALKRVSAVVVNVREAGGDWRVVRLGPAGGDVTTQAARVASWVQLEDERGWALVVDGSQSAPIIVQAGAPVATATPPGPTEQLTPLPPPPPPPTVSLVEPATSSPRFRPAAWTLVGTGVAALGIGLAFGLIANSERTRFTQATRDSAGVITGLTRQGALELDAAMRTHALVADILFAVGGALAATGVGLWIAGTISPAPAGGVEATVAISGPLP